MNVKLAVQVLSATTSTLLNTYYGHETTGTAHFCKYMNNFFDCINVRSLKEGKFQINIFCNHYENVNDVNAKRRMFISHQTYQGLQITVFSTIEATKYLLQHGCCNMYSRVSNNRLPQPSPPPPPSPRIVNFSIFSTQDIFIPTPTIINFQSFLLIFLSVNSHFHHSPS